MQPVAAPTLPNPSPRSSAPIGGGSSGSLSLGASPRCSLNSGTLVIALPDILRDLHTDLFALLWIVVGYTLVATVLVLNAGRLADMVGRVRHVRGRLW